MTKKVYYIVIILLVLHKTTAIAQSATAINNIEKNIAIADSLLKEFPDQAEDIYLRALSKSDSLKNDSLALLIIYKMGRRYNQTLRPQAYIDLSEKYFSKHEKYNDYPFQYINSIYLRYSAFVKLGDYKNAISEVLKADSLVIKLPEEKRNKYLPTNLYLANIYTKQNMFTEAIDLAQKGLAQTEKADPNNNYNLSYAYKILYESYFLLDSLQQSSAYYEKYIDKLKIHEKSLKFRAYHFSNFHKPMQSFATEEKLLELYNSLSREKVNYSIKSDIGFVLASLYERQKKYKKAISFWKLGIINSEDNDAYNLYPTDKIYSTYLKLNEVDSAATYMRMYNAINQRVINKNRNEEIEALNAKYQSSLKDSEINAQNLIIEKQKREKNTLVASIIIGLIMLVGTIWFLFSHLKHKKQITEAELEIKNQKISELQKERKILSMASMIEGQEAERVRIAKDLHDGLGGLLSTAKAHFSNIQSEIQKIEKLKVYNRANFMIDEACEEVRRISHNLMPATLKLDGLKSAVEQLAEDLSDAHPFTINTEFVGFEGTMHEKVEIFIFRIIQEATNNIVKYAKASEVLIQLSESDDAYNLIIEDNGIGFDKTQTNYGIGLKSIESRVDYLKGTLDIDSKIDEGTTISIALPKNKINE